MVMIIGRHHLKVTIALLWLLAFLNSAPAQDWTLTQTPAMTDFNGISISEDGFAVLVGNGGSIVHRDAGGNFMDMPSGTQQDLFDVHVVDESFAVAVGMDIGLIWDGTQWTAFFTDNSNTVYTSVWATPDKEAVIYNFGGAQFVFHTVYYPQTQTFLPVSGVSNLDVAFCGESDDIKIINQRGDIINVNNSLLPAHASQTQITLFDNSSQGAQFNAAWISPLACLPGHALPDEAYAIDLGRSFMRFRPETGWTPMPVSGGAIPNDHNLTWIGGFGSNLLFATGFKPGGTGNQATLWLWQGQRWTEVTDLPDDVPGLTDIDARLSFNDELFDNGFEAVTRSHAGHGRGDATNAFGVDILAAAESGVALGNNQLAPMPFADLEVRHNLLTTPPYFLFDLVELNVDLINRGPSTTVRFRYILVLGPALLYLSDSCGTEADDGQRIVTLDLGAGQTRRCIFQFTVMAEDETFANSAYATPGYHDAVPSNNYRTASSTDFIDE